MQDFVGSFFCEWTETLKNPERRRFFSQFANTDDAVEAIEPVTDRGQSRPAYWPSQPATEDFRGHKWSTLTWQPLVLADKFTDTPTGSAVAVKRSDTQLAIFKIRGKYYTTQQMCPHKRAFALSEGLIGDAEPDPLSSKGGEKKLWVSCPFHKRNFSLSGADAGKCSNDESVNVAVFPTEERDDGWVYVKLPPIEELDGLLGTERWKVKAGETQDPFSKMDEKVLKGVKGKRLDGSKSHLEDGRGEVGKAKAILKGEEKDVGGMDW